jgi:hypothetical protein
VCEFQVEDPVKNIEVVMSNGRVTDTSAVLKRTWPATPHQLRLAPGAGVEASRCSSQSVSRAVCPLRKLCRIMVRYAPLVLQQRPKPSRVIGRMRAASALSRVGDNGVSSGDCRDAVSSDVYEEICAWLFVVRSTLSILQSLCVWQRFRTRYCVLRRALPNLSKTHLSPDPTATLRKYTVT